MRLALLLVVAAGAVRVQPQLTLLQSSDEDSPIEKVVSMLKDMHKNLQDEFDEDKKMFEKIACWCHDNKMTKGFEIDDGMNAVEQLTSAVKSGEAREAQLKEEIDSLKTEIEEERAALEKAQAVRDEQLAEFRKGETECMKNQQALKDAITVLGKHFAEPEKTQTEKQKDAFKYNNMGAPIGSEFMQSRVMAPAIASRVESIVARKIDHQTAAKVSAALTQMAQNPFGDYHSQSGEIVGVLKQLADEMASDCGAAFQEETRRAESFAELKAAKQAQIDAALKGKASKEDQLAKVVEKLAEDRITLDDKSRKLASDREFLANVENMCTDTDGKWDARQKARMEELKAVSETIEILTSEEARAHFSGSFDSYKDSVAAKKAPAFLQLSAVGARQKAVALLVAAAKKRNDPALLAVASSVQMDAFTKVKAAINRMIAELKQEQADEVKHKDYCTSELNDNQDQLAENGRNVELAHRQIESTESSIEGVKSEIKELVKSIAEMEVELQKAGQTRVQESQDFQQTMNDQSATEKVIKMALRRMTKFYNKEAFAQTQHRAIQTPPGKIQEYKPSSASSPVISLLRDLIQDAKRLQAAAKKDEQDAWNEYSAFVKESNDNIASAQTGLTNKQKEKADLDKQLVQDKQNLDDLMDEQTSLNATRVDLHGECDFILQNFDVRQSARQEEIEALGEALGILSGALQ